MSSNKFTYTLFFLLLTLVGYSQNSPKTKVSGRIVDNEQNGLAYASVGMFSLPDSVLSGGAIADEAGKFKLDVPPGDYAIKIKLLGYSEKWVSDIQVEEKSLNLGDLMLDAGEMMLDAVEIEGEKNQMVLKLDKRVFNVQADLTNAGRNASEILDNIPSVTVDIDGNVALRGSQNVRILIDGKPSGLVGIGSTDALRMLQGSQIEKVEVITNPSARYDAEGEVGIINIVMKKEERKGVNGSYELTAGYPHNHQAGFNMNLRKKSVNLFANYSINYNRRPGGGYSFTEFDFGDTLYSFDRVRAHERGGLGNNLNAGLDIFLPKQQTLTLQGLYKYSKGNNLATLTYRDFDQNGINTGTSERVDQEVETDQVIEGSIGYVKLFPQEGRKWTIDAKVMQNDDTEKSDIEQTATDWLRPLLQRVSNTEDERQYFVQSDYIHPFGKNGKLETGVRTTLRRIQNDFGVDELGSDDIWFPLPEFNNNFVYTENIYAAYVMAGNQSGKFSYQAGLRAEYSDIITELTETNEVNPRNYLNLFPSAHVSYKVTDKSDIQLSYSRRLNRPRFRELLPFFGYSDNRVFYSGNPNLNPEYTHSLESGYLIYFKKGSLLSSAYYRYRTGVINRITQVDTTGFTTIFPVNLSVQHAYGLEFNLSYSPVKAWKINGNFNFYRAITEGEYEGQQFDADAITARARLTSKITLWKEWDMQLSWDYRAPENSPQGRVLSMWRLDFGLARDILKKKGTLTFTASDIFNTRRRRWITFGDNFYSENDFQWRQRQFKLTFNYRLNQDKKRGGRPEGGGDMDY